MTLKNPATFIDGVKSYARG